VFKDDPFIHISTTGGAELACVVALKMLEIQSDPKFLEHVKAMGKIFGKGLEEIKGKYPDMIKEVRGRGLMWGVEFYKEEHSLLAMISIIKEGVLLNYCGNKKDTLIIMPPLIVQNNEIDEIMERINKGIQNVKEIGEK
jgi:acetylornithine/succinyldiaminopimelate/putrescine aminotransferase